MDFLYLPYENQSNLPSLQALKFINECFKIPLYRFQYEKKDNLPLGITKITVGGGLEQHMPKYLCALRDPNIFVDDSSMWPGKTSYNDLIIVVRGSTIPSDWIRDAKFKAVKLFGGEVHSGALDAACWIISQIKDRIDYCRGRIFVIGHSLGAAVSSIIATILRKRSENPKNAYAIVAAPFPVFSLNIKEETKKFIIAFVHDNDIVPKLNTYNIRRFTENNSDGLGGILLNGIKDLLQDDFLGSTRNERKEYRLYAPGVIFNLKRRLINERTVYTCKPYRENQDIKSFDNIIEGINDHKLEAVVEMLGNFINDSMSKYY